MSLGDVYGRVTKSGNDKQVNMVTRSSEDGSEFMDTRAKDKKSLNLEHKREELNAIESQMTALHREIIHADLHKTDYESYKQKKIVIEAEIKKLDQNKRRLADEIHRLERDVLIVGKRHL